MGGTLVNVGVNGFKYWTHIMYVSLLHSRKPQIDRRNDGGNESDGFETEFPLGLGRSIGHLKCLYVQ